MATRFDETDLQTSSASAHVFDSVNPEILQITKCDQTQNYYIALILHASLIYTRPNRLDDVKLDDVKLDDVKLDDVKLDDVKLDDVKLAKVLYYNSWS